MPSLNEKKPRKKEPYQVSITHPSFHYPKLKLYFVFLMQIEVYLRGTKVCKKLSISLSYLWFYLLPIYQPRKCTTPQHRAGNQLVFAK